MTDLGLVQTKEILHRILDLLCSILHHLRSSPWYSWCELNWLPCQQTSFNKQFLQEKGWVLLLGFITEFHYYLFVKCNRGWETASIGHRLNHKFSRFSGWEWVDCSGLYSVTDKWCILYEKEKENFNQNQAGTNKLEMRMKKRRCTS